MWNGMVDEAWDSWIRKARLCSLMRLHSIPDPHFTCVFTRTSTAVKSTFEWRGERVIGLRFILPWFVYSFLEDVLDGRFTNRGGHEDQHKLDTKTWCAQRTYEGENRAVWQTRHCVQVSSSLLVFRSVDTPGSKSKFGDITLNTAFLFCRTGIAVIWDACVSAWFLS